MKVLEELKGLFKSYKVDFISPQAFINFEMRLYLLINLENNIGIDEGWSIFTQYFYDFILEEEDSQTKQALFKMRLDNHHLSTSSKWRNMELDYMQVPESLRIYDINEEKLIRIVARYANDREKEYKTYIEGLSTLKKRDVVFAEEGEDVIYEKKAYKVPIQPIIGERINPLSEYRNKKYIDLNEQDEWQEVLNTMGKKFKDRPSIKLNVLNQTKVLPLKGLVHIVGALGAGKSTYKYAQVVKGVKEENLKIAMIEESVGHVIETVNVLRELGIEAVPIIGSSNERKYLERYFMNFTNYVDLIGDEIMKDISGSCIVKALAEDTETKGFPCNKLYQEGQKVSCNYITSCGHMRRFRKLANAQVVVTTPHNLVKGNLVDPIDPYQRSIYEMLHDLMDMIIVDEADGIQSILEDQLMVDTKLNYGEYSTMRTFEMLVDELQKYKQSMKRYDRYKFITNYNQLNIVLGVAKRILVQYSKIHNYVLNKCLTPTEIFKDIYHILEREEQNKKFLDFVRAYVDITDVFHITEANIVHPLNEVFNKVANIHLENGKYPEKKLLDEIETLLQKYKVVIPRNERGKQPDRERLIQLISLLIILVKIDYLVKLLSDEYPYLYYEMHEEIRYIDAFTSPNMKLDHLIKEPCIGSVYGYKISFKNELEINILRYAAVGRSMLEKWPVLKEEIGLLGPAVICLSGTSHSPGSAHYHLKKNPDILLLGKPEGKISMKFLPMVYNNDYIRISGAHEDKRELNLRALCNKLIVEINSELSMNQGRKVLMIANSYADCRIIGECLGENQISYKVICNDRGENYLPKEALDQFEEESDEADVCVVPLTIISRGYNILNSIGDSYFGSLYFLVRPYMIPGDFSSYIQILHYNMAHICEDVKQSNMSYSLRIMNFRKRCFNEFSKILNMRYWKGLTDEQREIMTWYMLVPIKQAIGRMQRNGNSCKVYFCDSAFCEDFRKGKALTSKNSTLHSFYEVLKKYEGNRVIDSLYHQFIVGLEEMIKEIELNDEQEVEEW